MTPRERAELVFSEHEFAWREGEREHHIRIVEKAIAGAMDSAKLLGKWRGAWARDWRTIDTAPQDGTIIMVYMVERGERRYALICADDLMHSPAYLSGVEVIGWMPLPEPPTT
jgi:hypothetical protein